MDPWKQCEQGRGARISRGELDSLSLQVSTAGSLDTAFLGMCSLTVVERASCKVHRLLCRCWRGPHRFKMYIILLVAVVERCFTSREATRVIRGLGSPGRPPRLSHSS